jgi:hypothetical protein
VDQIALAQKLKAASVSVETDAAHLGGRHCALLFGRVRQLISGDFAFIFRIRFMQHNPVEWPEFANPCGTGQRPAGIRGGPGILNRALSGISA